LLQLDSAVVRAPRRFGSSWATARLEAWSTARTAARLPWLTWRSIRVFRGLRGAVGFFRRQAAQGKLAGLAPTPDAREKSVEQAMVEAGGDDSPEIVEELGVECSGDPQRRVFLFDHVEDGLGDVAGGIEGERHQARDQFVHVHVVRVIGILLVVERAS